MKKLAVLLFCLLILYDKNALEQMTFQAPVNYVANMPIGVVAAGSRQLWSANKL